MECGATLTLALLAEQVHKINNLDGSDSTRLVKALILSALRAPGRTGRCPQLARRSAISQSHQSHLAYGLAPFAYGQTEAGS